MLVYVFRVTYPGLKWRPKNVHDLLNRKLVRIWQAKVMPLDNITGRE